MKIAFSKKEYRILLEMSYLSGWFVNSHACNPEDFNQEHQALRKKLLSHFKEMGAEKIIFNDKDSDDYFETKDFEDQLHHKYIDPYDDENFWYELAYRLAKRDILSQFGPDKIESMDHGELFVRIERIEEEYNKEFEQHGLTHIKIDKMDGS